MAKKNSDKSLIVRVKAGSTEAFEELVQRYSVRVYSMAWRFTRNREDTEETVQDVFTTVYRNLGNFEEKCAFSSWIYRITVNCSLMTLRKKRRGKNCLVQDELDEECLEKLLSTAPEAETDSQVQARRIGGEIEAAVGRLPGDYRFVYVMRDIDGIPAAEVAKALKISVPAVKSRLHRSRLMMRKKLLSLYRDLRGKEADSLPMAAN